LRRKRFISAFCVVDEFQKKYPNLNVAGYRNGYYKANEGREIVEMITIAMRMWKRYAATNPVFVWMVMKRQMVDV